MIELEPVDHIQLTILVDNLTDPLLVDEDGVARINWPKALLGAVPRAGSRTSPEHGVPDALIAEPGFSAPDPLSRSRPGGAAGDQPVGARRNGL